MNNLLEKANSFFELGELEQAERVFERALAGCPEHPQILAGYARTATLQCHWKDALQRWQRVQDVLPDMPQARIGQGDALLELGELEQAEGVFQDALTRWPDHPYILAGAARTATLQRHWKDALQRWRRVQDVFPDMPQARIGQGDALLELGELEQAEGVFQDALTRWPDHSSILTNYARIATLQRRWSDALLRWKRVQEVLPENMYSQMEEVNALIELGELERAEKICLAAQSEWPNSPRPYYLHHIIVERQRRMQDLTQSLHKF